MPEYFFLIAISNHSLYILKMNILKKQQSLLEVLNLIRKGVVPIEKNYIY